MDVLGLSQMDLYRDILYGGTFRQGRNLRSLLIPGLNRFFWGRFWGQNRVREAFFVKSPFINGLLAKIGPFLTQKWTPKKPFESWNKETFEILTRATQNRAVFRQDFAFSGCFA